MNLWWVLVVVGVVAAGLAALLLFRRGRTAQGEAGYVTVPSSQEPIDPLLRSQLTASLSEAVPKRGNPLEGLRNWAAGTSDVMEEFEDCRRQMRTLQTYVLDLDSRYIRREEATWLSFQVVALVLGIATGVSTAVWALIELVK